MEIVTKGGWRIAACEFVADSPTRIAVRASSLSLQPHSGWSPGVDSLVALIGECPLQIESLRDWRCGGLLDFAKDPGQPVLLARAGEFVGAVDIDKADGQLALRVIEWNR